MRLAILSEVLNVEYRINTKMDDLEKMVN